MSQSPSADPFSLDDLLLNASGGRARRYTQDSPILPEVWLALRAKREAEVLLTPLAGQTAGKLAAAIKARLTPARRTAARVAYNDAYVVATLTLGELLTAVLPLARGWATCLGQWPGAERAADHMRRLFAGERDSVSMIETCLFWLAQVVGVIVLRDFRPQDPTPEDYRRTAAAFEDLARPTDTRGPAVALLARVTLNRTATQACVRSTLTVKADAARLLFNINTAKIFWAVIDSGIDDTHPAFVTDRPPAVKVKRVRKRYDFTRVRNLLSADPAGDRLDAGTGTAEKPIVFGRPARANAAKQARVAIDLQDGRLLDWARLEPLLAYADKPKNAHGTHVAGILAGDYCRKPDADKAVDPAAPKPVAAAAPPPDTPPADDGSNGFTGMCPQLNLYDLRVFDDDGDGDEFAILCALQFVRYLNAQSNKPVLHGINLSLSLRHDVTNYACGATPVCEECDRLTAAGTVVVAAAGNGGYEAPQATYQPISVTDPGNAESVITVGATHRSSPFRYGISYFSSRGPTADGRAKPDLVAPGEKIVSAQPFGPGESAVLVQDGTSMAAPHVSGAAALLMARNEELIGRPGRIKDVLCRTATDLGRTREFQGAGLLDVLRALQSL